MAALACGMTWIVLIRAMKTNTTRMIRTMMIGSIVGSPNPSSPRRLRQIVCLWKISQLKILLVESDRPSVQLGDCSPQLCRGRSHDDGCGSLDVHDVHFLAYFIGVAGVECACRPDL